MKANELEIAAYLAAHRILMADTRAPELACPGARRSHAIDTIAGIIIEVFEMRNRGIHECVDRREVTAEPVLLELPRQAS